METYGSGSEKIKNLLKDLIVIEVFSNPNIESYCKSVSYKEWEELRSELILQLLNMNEDKLIEAKNYNFLEYLCFKILKRILYGSVKGTGLFYKNKLTFDDIEIIDIAIEDEYEDKLSRIWEIVEGTHWYNKILFKAYYIDGLNLRQLEEKYGINQKSIHYAIQQVKKQIKKRMI